MLNKHEESVLNCGKSCENCALSKKCKATGVCLRKEDVNANPNRPKADRIA